MMSRAQGCGDAGEADVNAGDHYVTWRVMEENTAWLGPGFTVNVSTVTEL